MLEERTAEKFIRFCLRFEKRRQLEVLNKYSKFSIRSKPSTCLHTCRNCGCLFGNFEILLWIGSVKEVGEWLTPNTIELAANKINFTVERFYKCNVFVHQARIQPGIEKIESKLVITANGLHETTKVKSMRLQ